MNAIDTNLLVYCIDFNELDKQMQARELLTSLVAACDTVLLWQVVGEYLNCLRRFAATRKFPAEDIDNDIKELLDIFPLASPSKNVISLSLSLFSRYQLSHWDSMLLAACIEAGVDTLYSEDLSAGMTYDSVKVINPFSPPTA